MAEVLSSRRTGYTVYSMSVPTAAVPALMPNLGMRPGRRFRPNRQAFEISYNALVVTPVLSGEVSCRTGSRSLGRLPQSTISRRQDLAHPRISLEEMFKLHPTGIQAVHWRTRSAVSAAPRRPAEWHQSFRFLGVRFRCETFVAIRKASRHCGVTSPDRVAGLEKVATCCRTRLSRTSWWKITWASL